MVKISSLNASAFFTDLAGKEITANTVAVQAIQIDRYKVTHQ